MLRTSDARRALGLGAGPHGARDVKRAYREAARRLHPDRPDAPSDATDAMALVNLAYAVLSGQEPPEPETPPDPDRESRVVTGVVLEADGTLIVDGRPDQVFHLLLDAVDQIGDPTYVDEAAGLLQVIVHPTGGPWCYLTLSLHGRPQATEVLATIEPLDAAPRPALEPLLRRLVTALRLASP